MGRGHSYLFPPKQGTEMGSMMISALSGNLIIHIIIRGMSKIAMTYSQPTFKISLEITIYWHFSMQYLCQAISKGLNSPLDKWLFFAIMLCMKSDKGMSNTAFSENKSALAGYSVLLQDDISLSDTVRAEFLRGLA